MNILFLYVSSANLPKCGLSNFFIRACTKKGSLAVRQNLCKANVLNMHIGSQAFFAGRTGKGPLIHKFKEIPEFNFFDSKNFDINLRNGDVYQIGSTKLGGSQKFCSYAF